MGPQVMAQDGRRGLGARAVANQGLGSVVGFEAFFFVSYGASALSGNYR